MKNVFQKIITAVMFVMIAGGMSFADDGGIFSLLLGDNKIEVGTFTTSDNTVAFSAAFSSAPKVFCFWSDTSIQDKVTSSNTDVMASSITTTNFAPSYGSGLDSSATNAVYYAIGAK